MVLDVTPLPHSTVSIPAGADSGIINMDVHNSSSWKRLLPISNALKPSIDLVSPISVLRLKIRSFPLTVHRKLCPKLWQVKVGLGSPGQRTGLCMKEVWRVTWSKEYPGITMSKQITIINS